MAGSLTYYPQGYFVILAVLLLFMIIGRYLKTREELTEVSASLDISSQLLDGLDSLIVVTEMESDKIIYMNERMKRDFSFGDDIIGKRCWEALVEGAVERCAFCPKNNPDADIFSPVTWEFLSPITHKHYRIFSRATKWPDGSVVHFEQCIDITQMKETAAKLREADAYTRLLLDAMPISCALWNSDMQLVDCNNETLRLFELSSKQEFIEIFGSLSPPYQPNGQKSTDAGHEMFMDAVDNGISRREWMHKYADGEPLPCEVTMVRIKHRDNAYIASYTRDLREHKEFLAKIDKANEDLRMARDAADAANGAKTTFLANMSHEIRTPLNSIIGFSELAADAVIPLKTAEYLDKIAECAELLLKIVNDILDISKIESGKMELEYIPFNLHDIFAYCQSTALPKAAEKGVSLYCYAEPSIGGGLIGDPMRLRQAIMNILSNAVKFTDTGEVKLLASVKHTSAKSVTILFEIKDTGIGMTKEEVKRIFEPFIQADGSITRKYGGTGLGLTITRNLIEMMGGQLAVESEKDVGSKFGFTLTFETQNENTGAAEDEPYIGALEKPQFEGEILVCEDNGMNQQVICEHLSRVGILAVVAENGRECVEAVERRIQNNDKPFDLIFMDIHMPVMDGLEAAKKITLLGCKTPIVAMTANIMSNDIELYKSNGMSDYLGKPFTSQELWKLLMKYFPLKGVVNGQSGDDNMLEHLKRNFVKSNQITMYNIETAIDKGDLRLAHRLVHTLKSNAAQIGEDGLSAIAASAEDALTKGMLPKEMMEDLAASLKKALTVYAPLLEEERKENRSVKSPQEILDLFNRLEDMLNNMNPDCMHLVSDIRAIPQAYELARLVEEFEFEDARGALADIRAQMRL